MKQIPRKTQTVKLTQKELNRFVKGEDIELVIQNYPQRKHTGLDGFTG